MGSCDNGDQSDPIQKPDPRPVPAQGAPPAGWLYALNSFLERAFTEADRATGC